MVKTLDSTTRDTGLIPGRGSSTYHVVWPKKRIYSGISRGKAELRPREILEKFPGFGIGTGFLRKGETTGAPW